MTVPTTNQFSLIIPIRNEAENIFPLLTVLDQVAKANHLQPEIIFVDDGDDWASNAIESAQHQFLDLTIRVLERKMGERTGGLGGAVLAGWRLASHSIVGVMDGDLQHPPQLLPELLKTIQQPDVEVAIASRRVKGSHEESLGRFRVFVSQFLVACAWVVFPHLRSIADPLTGYFFLRLDRISLATFQPQGFKILLELLVRNPQLVAREIPFEFGKRQAGESKASAKEVWRYFRLLWLLKQSQRGS